MVKRPQCPACDYDLRGLGPEGRCPECGCAFDPNARVLLKHDVWTHAWRVLTVLGVPVIALVILTRLFALKQSPLGLTPERFLFWVTICSLPGLIALAVAAYRWRFPWHRFRSGRVFINRSGLHFREIGAAESVIELSAFERAECRRIPMLFTLRQRSGGISAGA